MIDILLKINFLHIFLAPNFPVQFWFKSNWGGKGEKEDKISLLLLLFVVGLG